MAESARAQAQAEQYSATQLAQAQLGSRAAAARLNAARERVRSAREHTDQHGEAAATLRLSAKAELERSLQAVYSEMRQKVGMYRCTPTARAP